MKSAMKLTMRARPQASNEAKAHKMPHIKWPEHRSVCVCVCRCMCGYIQPTSRIIHDSIRFETMNEKGHTEITQREKPFLYQNI